MAINELTTWTKATVYNTGRELVVRDKDGKEAPPEQRGAAPVVWVGDKAAWQIKAEVDGEETVLASGVSVGKSRVLVNVRLRAVDVIPTTLTPAPAEREL